ncbi:MAG: long-chain fatty acid--CoA ligase [Deltaproteobacteria bacterium]|nr:MAG: long-chain fatty acid--CoA ligase [Deltaproteobacteria bacterium]RLC23278.1 MAG: long-chain fatty acid--CoA ligase [Deltaproteobacteria bacterium]
MDNSNRLPLVNSYIDKWAKASPDTVAIIQHEDGREFTYKKFSSLIDFFALKLIDMDLQKGDRVATQLVLVPEHMALMYACFKIGVIFAPLDVRLTENEVVRDINKIEAKAFFFLGDTPVRDFRVVGEAVKEKCSSVKYLVQFTPEPKPGDIIQGALGITQLMSKPRLIWLKLMDMLSGRLKKIYKTIEKRTPALIIYTTGTTGEPKPAVLCHENIIVQNQVLERGIDYKGDRKDFSILVNLPPSHVGCITETFMTTMFMGGKAVFLRIFDIKASLEAIERHKIKVIGQIPTMFRMLWSFPEYKTYDLSSLEFVAYAGSAVDTGFLKKLSKMAPKFGTGIGMTENAGFATFTPADIPFEEMAGQVGRAFSDIARVSIRSPMKDNGTAGEKLPDGDIGEICYHPPIVFLGYYNQPEETKKAVSTEGILYTGDLGYFKQMDDYKALYLSGRKKFIIKQKGYNVFPGEIEEHIAQMDGVDVVEVIGMKHELFDEGIFAFVRPASDIKLSSEAVMAHCKSIASYKRPQHVEIWPSDKELPLTRSTKVDKLKLMEAALPVINSLRDKGKWDAH